MDTFPTLDDLRQAAQRITPYAHRTPIFTCQLLNHWMGAELFFKCENLQKCGAFKFRGACNTVFSLSEEEASCGVVTHSSGNHAAALAKAAQLRGIAAHIVMPSNAPQVKQAAVQEYGGDITLCAPTLTAREETAAEILKQTGGTLVHPYDDHRIIAGQGTVGLEILEQVPEADLVLVPVGGGGLLSGVLLAVKQLRPEVRVIACEPHGADDAYRSWRAGVRIPLTECHTIADGLRTSLGEKTFPIIQQHVDEIVCVSEVAIVDALRLVLERMKLVIEPSAAVPLAALLEKKIATLDRKIVVVLSGGNLDFDHLPF